MPVMSRVEQAFCRSAPWRAFSRRAAVPWATRNCVLHGDVLELGSGSGATAFDLLERYPITKLVATDVDPRMLVDAEQRLARFVPRVEVRRADATAMPFDDASFDAVVCFLMLHHVIEWEQALQEVFRVLRPAGSFRGYDLADTAPARLLHRLDGSPHRLATPDQVRSRFAYLRAREISIEPSFAGLVFRFNASKSGGSASEGTSTVGASDDDA